MRAAHWPARPGEPASRFPLAPDADRLLPEGNHQESCTSRVARVSIPSTGVCSAIDARRHLMRMSSKLRRTATATAAVALIAAGAALAAPGAAHAAPAAPGTQVTGTLANGTV